MSENTSTMDDYRRRCLKAVLRDDQHLVEQLCQDLVDTKGVDSLRSLLMEKQHFLPLGNDHNPVLLRALKGLMDTPLPLAPNHLTYPDSVLESYLRAYRGLFIHLAASLGRASIVGKLLNMAVRYQLDCAGQLIATDVNYNTALFLAFQNIHNNTVKKILNMLEISNSPCKQFVYRHCAVKMTQRVAWFFTYDLGIHIKRFIYDCLQFSYDILSKFELILCDDNVKFCSNGRNTSYYWNVFDVCPFYLAVLLHSNPFVNKNKWNLFRDLYDHTYTDRKSIQVLKMENGQTISGTAAHFAVSNYQLSSSSLKKKFPDTYQSSDLMNTSKHFENHCPPQGNQHNEHLPVLQEKYEDDAPPRKKQKREEDGVPKQLSGKVENVPSTRKISGNPPMNQGIEGDGDEAMCQEDELCEDHPIFDMLCFLHKECHVDLTEANWEGKTPLECLPPDADPALVNRLIEYIHNLTDSDDITDKSVNGDNDRAVPNKSHHITDDDDDYNSVKNI